MKNLIAIVVFICLLSPHATAQWNHVPNGSFEYYTQCSTNSGQLSFCVGWRSYSNGTPDYFHTCGNRVPNNNWGYQYAADANAYIGIIVYEKEDTVNLKEYAATQITPLIPGKVYEVSMSVSLSKKAKYGTNDLGIYFYDSGAYIINGRSVMNVTPQISFSNYGILMDTVNWVRLTDTFTADSVYNNIVIGGFLPYNNISLDSLGGGGKYAYYFIDSVVISIADSLAIITNGNSFCAGDSITAYCRVKANYATNNIFTVQLSDINGSFMNPINIGFKNSNTSDTIPCIIPSIIAPGANYRIRVIASNLPDTSDDNGYNIRIDTMIPTKPVSTGNSPICVGDSLQLSATTSTQNVTWLWTGPNNFTSQISSPFRPNMGISDSGYYIVRAVLNGCKSPPDTTYVIVYDTLTKIAATSNNLLCALDTLKLNASNTSPSGATYSWVGPNNFSSNQQNPVVPNTSTNASGIYIVTATRYVCSVQDTVTVTIKPLPTFSATNNTPICTGETINFTASSTSTGVTYVWTGPNSFNSTSATPSIGGSSSVHNGDYIVTATLNGCSLKDTVKVTVKPLPVKPVANNNGPLCAGATLNLTATTSTSGASYSWTGPNGYSVSAQNTVRPNSTTGMSGDYIVTAERSGCTAKDTVTVLVKPNPAAVSLTGNSPLCSGDTLYLHSTASTTGVSYNWTGPNSFTAATQNSFIFNSSIAATGWYIMKVELNGCYYTDSLYAIVHQTPATPSVSFNSPLCVGETLNLGMGAITGAAYNWTGPNNFTSNQQNPTRANMQFGDTGTYKVIVSLNGCTSLEGMVPVTINPLPFVVIIAYPADSICQGAPVVFNSYANNHGGTPQYQWFVNGIPAGTGTLFNSSALSNGDIVRCDMTENTKCSIPFTDPSNEIEMKVLPWLAPAVSISANPPAPWDDNVLVTFTATPTNGGAAPGYQWKRNGANVQGAINAAWGVNVNQLSANDKICVLLTSNYKCPQPDTALSNCINIQYTGVGDIDNSNNGIVLYPNPNGGRFTLSGVGKPGKEIRFEIINTLGQVVYTDKIVPGNGKLHKEIDLGNAATGVYLLRLHTGDEVNVVRFSVR